MDIKRRLIISNTITLIIPFIVTFLTAYVFIFVSTKVLHRDMSYDNFKRLTLIKSELLSIQGSLSGQDGIEETTLQNYLLRRLPSINGKFIILKGSDVVASSGDLNKIDIEKCIDKSRSLAPGRRISLNNINYIIEVSELILEDGTRGSVILLAPAGKEMDLFKELIFLIIFVFIGSFVVVNIISSYRFSKRILNPISLLQKAASEITSGNLEYEIPEEGDEEIRELCHDFETMRIQLKNSINMQIKYDDNRKALLSSISHDLKTPITSIKGYVEGILDGVANTSEKLESYLKTIYSKAEYMDGMIDDLLLYSRLDLKQLPFNFEKTDIVEYFNDCICETEGELARANIKISLAINLRDSRFVMMDRERMRRVIMNIIDNSRKYMNKEQGQITIGLRETNSSIIIEIRDNGRGISSEDVNKIFDRFYRSDLARSGTKGSGLGLAIAKEIVEGHGGRIWAVSHGEEGTSILISLKKMVERSL